MKNFFSGALLCALPLLSWSTPVPARAPGVPAAPTVRKKFALLVGITDYDPKYMSKLRGCVNDVAAMKASLVANFGFKGDDAHIKTLLNAQATHAGIVGAFREHLVANARRHPNAHFVFYFSGHGATAVDTSGDEEDGVDETLVPIDSTRDPGDTKHFDILDDQLDVLYRELSKELTPGVGSITFIFDSCHSGTGTRGQADQQVILKEAPRDDRPQPPVRGFNAPKSAPKTGAAGSTAPSAESERVALLPREGNFAALSGCLPEESSIDASFAGQSHGALTFYLLQAMAESTRTTTNGEVWEAVARGVSSKFASQHPQLEGRGNAPFLGGAMRATPPSIPYRFDKATGTLTVERGILNGARPGGFVGIYAPATNGEKGEPRLQGRLQIKSAGAYTSTAQADPKLDITPTGTAEILTPHFGAAPLRVRLDLPVNDPFAQAIRKYFEASTALVQIVAPGDKDAGDVAASIGRGKLGQAPPSPTASKGPITIGDFDSLRSTNVTGENKKGPISLGEKGAISVGEKGDPMREVYFISAGGRRVFGHAFEPGREAIETAKNSLDLCLDLENYARQLNMKSLSNEESKLQNDMAVSVLTVRGYIGADNRFRPDEGGGEEELPVDSQYTFDQAQRFKIRVRNKGPRELYAAILLLASDGGVRLLRGPNDTASQLIKPGEAYTSTRQATSGPAGVDTYKILVTSRPTNFAYLEQDAVKRGPISIGEKAAEGPLDILTGQAMGTRGGDDDEAADKMSFDDWTATQINFNIRDRELVLPRR